MDEILNSHYTGEKLLEKKMLNDGKELSPYLPSPELKKVVNLAIDLGMPLIIKGEPGSGKTKLAAAIAHEIFSEELERGEKFKDNFYFEWHVKSTSKAREGLYRYNYLQRLQHSQLSKIDPTVKVKEEFDYIKKGALGKAFDQSYKLNKNVVVLIDEIDKADIDFPNDLLRELDELQYTIEEIDDLDKREQSANQHNKPIIIITSNDDKELPLPFLRRCLFYYITFPSEDTLRTIVKAHFRDRNHDEEIIAKVVGDFYKVRMVMNEEKDEREKKITTSELIDWCDILLKHKEEDIIELLSKKLPYSSILFKNKEDFGQFESAHLE